MKKYIYLLTLLLTACQSPTRVILPPGLENLKIIPLQPSSVQPETLFQVSQNPADTGKIRVLIGSNQNFGIQKTGAQVTDLKLYLVPGNTGTQTPSFAGLIPKTAQTQAVMFTGVPGGSYYVAASAYAFTTNITDSNGTDHIQVNDAGLKHAFVSSSGGESSFPGRVTISADGNYSIAPTDTSTLVINLTLVAGP